MSDLRNLIIGAMLDALDDNMLAKHHADIEQMADEALAAVAPLIAKAERERCAVVALDYLNGIEKLTGQQAPGVVEAAAISIAAAIRALD
jgi:hypothetical protein